MADEFVNLHVHTEYSILDGMSHIDDLMNHTDSLGQKAIGITDHGVMFGVPDFISEAKKHNIKPIVGIEAYMALGSRFEKNPNQKRAYHQLLLSKNLDGYKNLMTLSSLSHTEGFYYKPRMDKEILAKHAEGLIVTTGCMGSEIPNLLEQYLKTCDKQYYRKARESFQFYLDTFGDDFYIELQPNQSHKAVENYLLKFSKWYNVPLIATTDAHYVRSADYDVHDTLLCLQTGRKKSDPITPETLHFPENLFYIMSQREIENHFSGLDVISHTSEIAEKVESYQVYEDRYYIPDYHVPKGHTALSYVYYLCEKSIKEKYPNRTEEAYNRLDYELGIIEKTGFAAYFLIVWDICMYARYKNIWWNVRGSAAGSIVAYLLDITSICPIENDLYFERFLNPDRVSMPDVDLDFEHERREELIDYVVLRYGKEFVSAITTFGKMKAKNSFRDTARVYDMSLQTVNRLASFMDGNSTLDWNLENIPEIKSEYENNSEFKHIWDVSTVLENTTRSEGIHPAGIIVSSIPLANIVAMSRMKSDKHKNSSLEQVVQTDMRIAEKIGLLKIDFLGLKTLSIVHQVSDLVYEKYGQRWHLDNIPYTYYPDMNETDRNGLDAAFRLLSSGRTAGIFQVESIGMATLLKEMKPFRFSHIVDAIALYRPGPMDYIPAYIRRMHGEEEVSYHHEKLEPIISETQAVIIYQEQLMRIASELFGYSRGEADLIRKAVGKKNQVELQKHKSTFVKRGPENGLTEEISLKIWEDYETFARYGFNKSHSSDYAKLTLQTAFLKAMYPLEYLLILMRVYYGNPERFFNVIQEAKTGSVDLLPPSINYSSTDFEIEGDNAIRFGFSNVKNVGASYIEPILIERQNGQFESLSDLIKRLDINSVNKRAFENLIRVGCFDELSDLSRSNLLNSVEQLRILSKKLHKTSKKNEKPSVKNQISLLDFIAYQEPEIDINEFIVEVENEVSQKEILLWEKDLLGMYVTARPTDRFIANFEESKTVDVTMIDSEEFESYFRDGTIITVAGEVTAIHKMKTKKNDDMAFLQVEDWHPASGAVSITLFPEMYQANKDIKIGNIIMVTGTLNEYNGKKSVIAQVVQMIEE